MADTIPNLPATTHKMDTAFTHTWYEMRQKAIDNILDANVLTAALRANGCFMKQIGGRHIARTIRYGTKTATHIKDGDTLPTGKDEADTQALFNWKTTQTHVQRSYHEDQQNQGPSKIKDLVQTKLEMARDALETDFENSLMTAVDTDGGKELRATEDPYSIQNLMPEISDGTAGVPTSTYGAPAAADSYTYGRVDRNNTWWQPKGVKGTAPALMNLEADMKSLYNYCTAGGTDHPNLIVTEQRLHEAYEDICAARIQIVADVGSPLAKLGFEVLKYRGAQVIYTTNSAIDSRNAMFFLNTKWIDIVYDPTSWFQMIPFQYLPNSLTRVARIVCTWTGMISGQMRRHGCTGPIAS